MHSFIKKFIPNNYLPSMRTLKFLYKKILYQKSFYLNII